MNIFSLGFLALIGTTPVDSHEFFVKAYDAQSAIVQKVNIPFELNEKNDIRFQDTDILERLAGIDTTVSVSWLEAQEPSDVEKVVDASFMILTSLMVLATHERYDISPELKMTALRGVFFLFFPFDDYFLYVHCNNDQHLVATSTKPSEDTLKRMKSTDEIRELCQPTQDPS